MITWMLHWRDDTNILERICPHGIGHPDPDTVTFLKVKFEERGKVYTDAHGCDGCCVPQTSNEMLERLVSQQTGDGNEEDE